MVLVVVVEGLFPNKLIPPVVVAFEVVGFVVVAVLPCCAVCC